MKIIRGLYTAYGLVVFTILFFLLFPFLLIPVLFRKQYQLVGVINRWWARLLFIFIGLPWKIEFRSKLDRTRQYIFCPNHFSYLDIPAIGLNPINTIFVGKSAMEKIPLFGFMYRKLHITVDRSKLMSKYSTLLKSLKAIDEGKNLVIFPEGGIMTSCPPKLAGFKDGAFRTAIEKQIPLVPVTIPYNWIILPDDKFLLRWKPVKIVFHDPMETAGLTLNDLDELKQKLKSVIDKELKEHQHEDKQGTSG